MSVFSDNFNTSIPLNWETIEFSARCAGLGGIRGPISVAPTPSWWLRREWYVKVNVAQSRAVLWYHPCFQEAVNRL